MLTGKLDKRITIKGYNNNNRDSRGNIIPIENSSITVWANVEAYGAKIINGEAENINEVNYRVIIRYRSDVSKDHIIFFNNKKLTMIAPPYPRQKVWLQMDCRELVET